MVIWISGMPGSGKSTLAKFYFKKYKKKFSNIILIDGDGFRKSMNNDLGYTIEDRKINAQRLIKFVKNFADQQINVIVSANLIFKKYRDWCKKKIPNFLEVYVECSLNTLKKRNKKKRKNVIKDVLGEDIKVKSPKNPHLIIKNVSSKRQFLDKIKIINSIIIKKKLKIF
tara:strand:+ start:45 stop:554 length:510 start_codon:yes stop_codon:yes gene_type:complete